MKSLFFTNSTSHKAGGKGILAMWPIHQYGDSNKHIKNDVTLPDTVASRHSKNLMLKRVANHYLDQHSQTWWDSCPSN